MKKPLTAFVLFSLFTASAFATELSEEEGATHTFAAYAATDAGAAEVTLYSDFFIDAAELYEDDSYREEDYPIPTETDAVLDAMWDYTQVSEDEVTEQFTVEESYFGLDEEDFWYVSIGIDLENDIAEILFEHTFYVASDDEDELLAAALERLESISRDDLDEHFTYYFKEEQDSSIYGVVIITDLFGEGEESEASIFSDVDSDYTYYDAIDYVEVYGIVEGYDDGTYRPANSINRAEFTKILMEAKYPGEAQTGTDCFTDVADEWYAKYVCLAEEKGVISGYSDGSFKPAQYVNIAEALKITLETYFSGSFEETTSPWYAKYWDFADDAGYLLSEWGSADEELSRGAMAELIYRIEN